jgi:hypothetical protein
VRGEVAADHTFVVVVQAYAAKGGGVENGTGEQVRKMLWGAIKQDVSKAEGRVFLGCEYDFGIGDGDGGIAGENKRCANPLKGGPGLHGVERIRATRIASGLS